MQILIPRTDLAKSMLFPSLLFVAFFQTPQWIRTPMETEPRPVSEPVIVFHCADWVTDTLPSYDLDLVLNNPLTIGNPDVFSSPKTSTVSNQSIPNGEWQNDEGAGFCNFSIKELTADSMRNLGFLYAKAKGVEGTCVMSLFWRDRVEYATCEEMQTTGIYARVYRRWSAICMGARKDTVQAILFRRPGSEEFLFNTNGEEIGHIGYDRVVTYQACSGDKSLIQKKDVTPYMNSYFATATSPRLAFMDEAHGKYGIQLLDKDFPTCGNNGIKIDRRIYVFDSCQGKYIDTFRVLIKIGDYQGPKFIKTKELPELHINSSDGKVKFGINRSELAIRFGVQIEECFLGGMSAWVEILTAANEWQEVRGAATTSGVSLPAGHYRLHVFAGDACFNTAQDSFEFVVKNELGPIPICVINGLSVESLLPDGQGGGMFTLKATDFVGGPIYDQNGQGPDTLGGKKLITHYSINRIGQVVDSNQKDLKLTCADAGKVIIVELHAWDQNGHDGFCVTYVEVQNNNRLCLIGTPSAYIAGTVEMPWYEGVQNVSVTLSGHNILNTAKTVKNGGYSFINLTRGEAYRVTPKLDEKPLNGVSTFDILLIQRHILGIHVLSSPYKMIAADVNNSGSISTLDLIQIRKLILGIDTRFSNNNSWRFVEADYTFPNPNNPWVEKFPESTFIPSLFSAVTANFVAIKIGDVNASVKANGEE